MILRQTETESLYKRGISAIKRHGLLNLAMLITNLVFNKLRSAINSMVYSFLKPHEEDLPSSDFDVICEDLSKLGYEIKPYIIDISSFENYLARAEYPESYVDSYEMARPGRFRAKALEHFVSETFFNFSPGDVYLDVASARSPYTEIATKAYPGINAYKLDYFYEKGINGHYIGADATKTGLGECFCNKISLHCSFEMFLNEDDIRLMPELYRILIPGGVVVIMPLYMYQYGYIRRPFLVRSKEKPLLGEGESKVWDIGPDAMRRYGPETLKHRILDNATEQGFEVQLYRMINLEEVTKQLDSPMILVLKK